MHLIKIKVIEGEPFSETGKFPAKDFSGKVIDQWVDAFPRWPSKMEDAAFPIAQRHHGRYIKITDLRAKRFQVFVARGFQVWTLREEELQPFKAL